MKPLPPKAPHKDTLPGRHCWLCGRPGGAGFKSAFVIWGYDVPKHGPMIHAHPECMRKLQRKQS